MLIKYTSENTKIPYHNKVIKKYSIILSQLPQGFADCNPIISGSAPISWIFSSIGIPGDYDFYFSSEEDFQKAFNLIQSSYPADEILITQNAVTYKKFQLVKKFFLPPQELIYNHDFVNCSVCIQNDNIYLTTETISSWYNNDLIIRDSLIFKRDTDYEKIIQAHIFLNRIKKYTRKFNLSIPSQTIQTIKQIVKDLSSLDLDLNQVVTSSSQEPILDYYGNPIKTLFLIKDIISDFHTYIAQNTDSLDNENNLF